VTVAVTTNAVINLLARMVTVHNDACVVHLLKPEAERRWTTSAPESAMYF